MLGSPKGRAKRCASKAALLLRAGDALSVTCGGSSPKGRAKGVCEQGGGVLSVTCGDSSPRGRAKRVRGKNKHMSNE